MRSLFTVPLFLVGLLSIPEAVRSQVSRVTVAQPVPGAVIAVLPTSVPSTPLPGLQELSLLPGDQVFVRESAKLVISPGSFFRRETRDGRLVLVETKYEVVPLNTRVGIPNLKATAELIHPGDSKLIYTGPWVAGWMSLSSNYVYLFRPIESPSLISKPRVTTTSFAELNAGKTAPAGTARVISNPSQLLPSTAVCGVPTTTTEGLGGLLCLLLKDGQATTLPSGIKLFRRQVVTEVWSGDQLIDQSDGLLVRDSSGRHWFLERKGYN